MDKFGNNSHVIVIIEKKPKDKAATSENPIAKIFLIFNCRTNETTDKIATSRKINPNTTTFPPQLLIHFI